jgi:hypothetical protein
MKTRISSLLGLFLGIWLTFSAAVSFAQTRPEYIPLGGGVKGVLYRPDSNPSSLALTVRHKSGYRIWNFRNGRASRLSY